MVIYMTVISADVSQHAVERGGNIAETTGRICMAFPHGCQIVTYETARCYVYCVNFGRNVAHKGR